MDYVSKLMRRYRELVTNPSWRAEQERREAEKLERFVWGLMEWDGVSEDLPRGSPEALTHPSGWRIPRFTGVAF